MQPDTTAGPQITQFPPPTRKMLMISTDVDKGDDANSMTEKSEVCIDLEANPVVAEPGHTDPSADKDKVLWDGPNDTDNPIHWPTWKKFLNGGLISFLTLLTPLASSFFAPSVPEVMQEFNTDNDLLSTFVVSIYVLGFAFGPLLMAPLSEIYGRVLVYHACNVGFVIFVVACAMAPSLEALIAFRFMSGLFGSCPLANAIGSIADMVLQEKCASAIAAVSIGPLVGPIIGPIAGGFLAAEKGWRWVFWVLAIVAGVLTIAMLLLTRETYAPVILERKAKRLRREIGNKKLRSIMDKGLSPGDHLKRALLRPAKMLVLSPLVLALAIYSAVVYGYLYVLFSSITLVFQQVYDFSTNLVGLAFIGIGVGTILALGIYARISDAAVKRAKQHISGPAKPEIRLFVLPLGAFLIPAGFFVYGWTSQYGVYWIAPEIGLTMIGLGNLFVFMAISMYLIDTYTIYSASALAAVTVIRSIGGAVLPLAALPMYNSLGFGWGNSVLGFIAVGMIPFSFLIIRHGERLREHFEIKNL